MEQKKIYIVSYPTENTAQGRRKPMANTAIIDQINEGTVFINYTGHGSESVWAHEQVFVSDVTIPQLTNRNRLTFFASATCTFGLYDRPGLRSGTELFVLKPDGGAIGGLSSPRVVFSNENSAFNREFLMNLLSKGRESDGQVKRIGLANYAAKQVYFGSGGYEKFHLFCDPTIRLALPRYTANIDSILINGVVSNVDTAQLRALSKVTLFASVRKPDQSVWKEYNGISEISLFDAQRFVPVPEWGSYSYPIQGGLLYRGQASIREGAFDVTFIVPKDISYENNTGRLSMYVTNNAIDGRGYSTSFRVGGSDSTAGKDESGPEIQLFMDTRSFKSGDLVNENSMLIADLYDQSGINTTGLSIGHNIEAWLDDSEKSIVLNEYFKGEIDSYQRGTIEYPFKNLSEGYHTLRFRAWDIYDNSTTTTTTFRVANSAALSLQSVFNYPNPMAEKTTFTFQHNLSETVNIQLKIYSISGRLVKIIDQPNVADRAIHIDWNGRDDEGDLLANGVYFYKVICSTINGGRVSEVLGKLTVLK